MTEKNISLEKLEADLVAARKEYDDGNKQLQQMQQQANQLTTHLVRLEGKIATLNQMVAELNPALVAPAVPPTQQ